MFKGSCFALKFKQLYVLLKEEYNLLKSLAYISFFLMVTSFFSCEEEIAIDYIDVEKFVVVNSSFSPSEEFEIQLDFSRNILDSEDESTFIEDADVKIFNDQGNFLIEFVHVGQGKYLTPDHTHPIEDKIYRLEVKVDGYPTITAASRVPKAAIVENIETTEINKDGESIVKVDFDIKDAEDIDNYYIWEVFKGDPEQQASAAETSVQQGIQTLGPSDSAVTNGKWSKLFVQETDLNQGVSFLSFSNSNNSNNGASGSQTDPSPDDEPDTFLSVISASSDYYNFLLSVELHQNSRNTSGVGSGSSSSLTPIELHTNIDGGLGIFAGYNKQTHKLESQ